MKLFFDKDDVADKLVKSVLNVSVEMFNVALEFNNDVDVDVEFKFDIDVLYLLCLMMIIMLLHDLMYFNK